GRYSAAYRGAPARPFRQDPSGLWKWRASCVGRGRWPGASRHLDHGKHAAGSRRIEADFQTVRTQAGAEQSAPALLWVSRLLIKSVSDSPAYGLGRISLGLPK